ncbi:MAG TPA: LysM peptidoglycan-binding domain-containing protein [Anaerolineae bacterium]|nr:LysM peptidoglycan-binding domain-containing protein [Anaerolineae bacterium]
MNIIKRFKRLGWGMLFIGLLVWWGQGQGAVAAQSGPASEMFQLVNQMRAEGGVAPLKFNSTLAIAAQRHANWMAANIVYTSHTGGDGSTPRTRAADAGYNGYVAETIVGGTGMSPRQGLIWWKNSAIHYQTLMAGHSIEAGTAYARNEAEGVIMYVMVLGRPRAAGVAPVVAEETESPAPILVAPVVLSTPKEDGSIVHVVGEGQALWTLAAHYDVDVNYLLQINNMKESDFVQPGDEITIRLPEGQPPPPTPTPPLSHIVQPGDTPWGIAAEYGLTIDELLWYNGLNEYSLLSVGDEVVIRLLPGQAPPPTPTPSLTHAVRAGDTPLGIALSYGLSLEEFLALNGWGDVPLLQIGQVVQVRPSGGVVVAVEVAGADVVAEEVVTPRETATSVLVAEVVATPPPAVVATGTAVSGVSGVSGGEGESVEAVTAVTGGVVTPVVTEPVRTATPEGVAVAEVGSVVTGEVVGAGGPSESGEAVVTNVTTARFDGLWLIVSIAAGLVLAGGVLVVIERVWGGVDRR